MTFTNGIAYAKDHQFVQDELAPLTPDDVARWMCQKAYGTPEPDANPSSILIAPLLEEGDLILHAKSFNAVEFNKWARKPNKIY
jgi:hypothetical protein